MLMLGMAIVILHSQHHESASFAPSPAPRFPLCLIPYLSGNDSYRCRLGRHYIRIDAVGSVICAAGQRMVED